MLKIIVDNSHPSSSLDFEEFYDEDGFPFQSPYITLNENQIKDFQSQFHIGEEECKEVIIAHEIGHFHAWSKGLDHTDEKLAWDLAPRTNLSPEKVQEIREFCLKTYE